jgi:cell division protease FtsH
MERSGPAFGPWAPDWGQARSISEETQRLVDKELKAIIEREHTRAREELGHARGALDAIATDLLTRETLERGDLEALVKKSMTDSGRLPIEHPEGTDAAA